MTFNILLGISVLVFLFGVLMRVYPWFSQGIQPSAQQPSLFGRIAAAVKATIMTLFSPKIAEVGQSIAKDLFFQQRVFEKNILRWLAHTLIFFGFVPLFFFHALGWFTSEPTLNPWMFLRNLFGLMVLAGVCLAAFRRFRLKELRLKSYVTDWTALAFVGVIILTGFTLESIKISSYAAFQGMVEEYGDVDGDEDILALEAYWAKNNGLISPNINGTPDEELVTRGFEVNEASCVTCHSAAGSAFVSFNLSKILGPIASLLGSGWIVSLLWFLHIVACLGFLAWLPFSKMFHVIAAPISLIIKRVMGDTEVANPANVLTRQMIGLSACTHCGSCSVECSSLMFYEQFKNDFILPSEKVQYLQNIAAGKEVDASTRKRLQEGLYICTSCDRCTTICPSGINLKEIFVSARYALLEKGEPETSLLSHFSFPLALAQRYSGDHLKALKAVEEVFKKTFKSLTDMVAPLSLSRLKGLGNDTYKSCYTCQRCTNVCPVVRSYEHPGEALGLLPHQIIYSLGLGNVELAMGSKMIWSCSTCYLCQEHCPNKVELTDIFYNLKNKAINKIEAGAN